MVVRNRSELSGFSGYRYPINRSQIFHITIFAAKLGIINNFIKFTCFSYLNMITTLYSICSKSKSFGIIFYNNKLINCGSRNKTCINNATSNLRSINNNAIRSTVSVISSMCCRSKFSWYTSYTIPREDSGSHFTFKHGTKIIFGNKIVSIRKLVSSCYYFIIVDSYIINSI